MAGPAARDRLRLLGWGLLTLGAGLFALGGVQFALSLGLGYDAHAYWASWRGDLYGASPLERDAYLYSPLFAQLVWPLTLLPWPAFYGAWVTGLALVFAWLLRPLGPRWMLPALLMCVPEIVTGNVYALLAAALVLVRRHPAALAVPLLTKVTPAIPLLVWFAVSRRWRPLAGALLLCGLAVGLSALLAPHLWVQWVSFLVDEGRQAGSPVDRLPLELSLPLRLSGLLLAVGAAATSRPWLLAPAAVCLSPTLGLNTLTLLAAVPRLRATAEPHAEPALSDPAPHDEDGDVQDHRRREEVEDDEVR